MRGRADGAGRPPRFTIGLARGLSSRGFGTPALPPLGLERFAAITSSRLRSMESKRRRVMKRDNETTITLLSYREVSSWQKFSEKLGTTDGGTERGLKL